MQPILVNEGLTEFLAAFGREGLAQRMVIVEKILPDRLTLQECVQINLLFLRFWFRFRLRFWFRCSRHRRGGSTLLQRPNICGKLFRLLLNLTDTGLKKPDLLPEFFHFSRSLTILRHRCLDLRRKPLRLCTQP